LKDEQEDKNLLAPTQLRKVIGSEQLGDNCSLPWGYGEIK
jgi:hypothetical protein